MTQLSDHSLALTPPQAEVIDAGLLDTGFSCILQMPTGSGKTWLAETAIEKALDRGFRAVYLTPLRALATELVGRCAKRFSQPVGIFTGDYGPSKKALPVSFKDSRLLVMTPERLDACTRSWRAHWGWIPDVDLVVVDELHLLGDPNRGRCIEGALCRFRRLNPFVRILGLSATLGNRTELSDWLGGVDFYSEWRQIPLDWRVVRYRKATDKPGLLLEEVSRNVESGGKSLVFVQSRRRAEELAHFLAGEGGLRAGHHHAGLVHSDRSQVEGAFRSGGMDVLVATATLEMGMNLPVRQVVLYDLQVWDGRAFGPLSTNSVWQRAGRAGRPGLDAKGEVVLLSPSWDRSPDRYTEGRFEPIRSSLSTSGVMAEQIVAEVASGLSRTHSQLQSALSQTLAFHQKVLPNISAVIADMTKAGMIRDVQEEEGEKTVARIRATRLGRIASRHLLSPSTLVLLQIAYASDLDLTFFDILIFVACTEDCMPLLSVDFEELDSLAADLTCERSAILRLSRSEAEGLLSVSGRRLLSAMKTALVARAWTRTTDEKEVAEQYDCYPFEVLMIQESFERLLLAMSSIPEPPEEGEKGADDLANIFVDDIPTLERVKVLSRMVTSGLDESTVTMTLVEGIGPRLAKRLRDIGVEDIEDLAMREPEELSVIKGISETRCRKWIDAAEKLVSSRGAYSYRETGTVANLESSRWPKDVDPYRLRRALDLEVCKASPTTFRITGGLEPHIVEKGQAGFACDCVDAAKGNTCKHTLAVRLSRKDPEIKRLAKSLANTNDSERLDLFSLWYEGGSPRGKHE